MGLNGGYGKLQCQQKVVFDKVRSPFTWLVAKLFICWAISKCEISNFRNVTQQLQWATDIVIDTCHSSHTYILYKTYMYVHVSVCVRKMVASKRLFTFAELFYYLLFC